MRSSRVLECVAQLPRLAIVRALREHPEWSLEDLFSVIDSGGPHAAALGKLTIADLLEDDASEACPTIDRARLSRALQVDGPEFDQLVLEVLREASSVARGYLLPRLGGPRWKLQNSLRRLVADGKVARRGNTSTTRYWAVPP